jgi:hypothetical protein
MTKLTNSDIAKLLKVSERQIYNLLKKERIFSTQDLLHWILKEAKKRRIE